MNVALFNEKRRVYFEQKNYQTLCVHAKLIRLCFLINRVQLELCYKFPITVS